jgi:hypothetical protein
MDKVMKKDRIIVCSIISKMIDSIDDLGLYDVDKAYEELEEYIESQRDEALEWMYNKACSLRNVREEEFLDLYKAAFVDLSK